jgi:DNA invertase Pin-like site-specific DNA recombinase
LFSKFRTTVGGVRSSSANRHAYSSVRSVELSTTTTMRSGFRVCAARDSSDVSTPDLLKLARRPELDKALLIAREGDQFVVTKLDRLERSLENLIELSDLQTRSVGLVVLDQGFDASTAIGRMFFQILGAVDAVDANGKQKWTVQQIVDEFGVTRPTIYRHLDKTIPAQPTASR